MSRLRLEKWERELNRRINDVYLLGELNLTSEQTSELGKTIGDFVNSQGWDHATEVFGKDYPCVFATYLVFQGVHGYEKGNFWTSVSETTGLRLTSEQTSQWGRLFEKIIRNLSVTPLVRLGGNRYVSAILAQGGIPDYSLPDFFERFIWPWVTDSRYIGLDSEEYVERQLQNLQGQVDKPIVRFLRYGGEVAEDFVERCRDMALYTLDVKRAFPPEELAEEVGLSISVIKKYQEWFEEQKYEFNQTIKVFQRPTLFLDPWNQGVGIHCPRTLTSGADGHAIWRVYGDSKLLGELNSESETIIYLNTPASEYRVELLCEQNNGYREVQHIWKLPGLSNDHSVMVFDPRTGDLISSKRVLPYRPLLWLLYDPSAELHTEPAGTLHIAEEFPKLPWGWGEFCAVAVDLAAVQKLKIGNRDNPMTEFIIQSSAPNLMGTNLCCTADKDSPLYLGLPPKIMIPFQGDKKQLNKWHIKVKSDGDALPNINTSINLGACRKDIDYDNKVVILSLDRLLGISPIGKYKVVIRGPLGYRKTTLGFRILPVLQTIGYDNLYLPNNKNINFIIITSPQVNIVPQPDAEECYVTKIKESGTKSTYRITIGVNMSSTPLRFMSKRAGRTIQVDVSLPVQRLRWKVMLDAKEINRGWETTPISLSLEELERNLNSYLFVDLFGGSCKNLKVRLLLEDDKETVCQEDPLMSIKPGQPYMRCDLLKFLDTLRYTSSSTFALKIALQNLPDNPNEVTYPMLFIEKNSSVIIKKNTSVITRKNPSVRNQHAYECTMCGYIYDPAEGDPFTGIAPGTSFYDLPKDWRCPDCDASKDKFEDVG